MPVDGPFVRDDLEHEIDEGHPGSLCPICDSVIMEGEDVTVIVAHKCQWLVHSDCICEDE
jgi:hypothetical protein